MLCFRQVPNLLQTNSNENYASQTASIERGGHPDMEFLQLVQDWQGTDPHQTRNQGSHPGANQLPFRAGRKLGSQPGSTSNAQVWARWQKSFPTQIGNLLFQGWRGQSNCVSVSMSTAARVDLCWAQFRFLQGISLDRVLQRPSPCEAHFERFESSLVSRCPSPLCFGLTFS